MSVGRPMDYEKPRFIKEADAESSIGWVDLLDDTRRATTNDGSNERTNVKAKGFIGDSF